MRILLLLNQAKPQLTDALSNSVSIKLHVEDVIDFLLYDTELISANAAADGEEANVDQKLVTQLRMHHKFAAHPQDVR